MTEYQTPKPVSSKHRTLRKIVSHMGLRGVKDKVSDQSLESKAPESTQLNVAKPAKRRGSARSPSSIPKGKANSQKLRDPPSIQTVISSSAVLPEVSPVPLQNLNHSNYPNLPPEVLQSASIAAAEAGAAAAAAVTAEYYQRTQMQLQYERYPDPLSFGHDRAPSQTSEGYRSVHTGISSQDHYTDCSYQSDVVSTRATSTSAMDNIESQLQEFIDDKSVYYEVEPQGDFYPHVPQKNSSLRSTHSSASFDPHTTLSRSLVERKFPLVPTSPTSPDFEMSSGSKGINVVRGVALVPTFDSCSDSDLESEQQLSYSKLSLKYPSSQSCVCSPGIKCPYHALSKRMFTRVRNI